MMAAQLLGTGGVRHTSFCWRRRPRHRRSWTLHCCWRCLLRSRAVAFVRSASDQESKVLEGKRAADEPRALHLHRFPPSRRGAFFFFGGGRSVLLRFPDSLTRLHALTKVDNLGLGLVVLGLLPQSERAVQRVEVGEHLAAGPIVRRDRYTAHCRRGFDNTDHMDDHFCPFSISVLVVLILGIGASTIAAPRSVRCRYRLLSSTGCCCPSPGSGSLRSMSR